MEGRGQDVGVVVGVVVVAASALVVALFLFTDVAEATMFVGVVLFNQYVAAAEVFLFPEFSILV